ncbi:MAG: bifunctional nuclease family protein [Chloroflexi bacterium]|nr:bifunctional nuclease family protein [Chloroflexota bacterium]
MIEMLIDSLRVSMMNYQRVVILKEKTGDRYLPIWIGPAEADAIAIKLQDIAVPRPLTHDLLRTVIYTLNATIAHVLVCDLKNDTFFARIVLNTNGNKVELDSRPSDAIALAVRTKVPIYADEGVLDKAGILLDKDTGKPIVPKKDAEGGGKVDESEMKRLSAFTEFINTLDLEDLDKKDKK